MLSRRGRGFAGGRTSQHKTMLRTVDEYDPRLNSAFLPSAQCGLRATQAGPFVCPLLLRASYLVPWLALVVRARVSVLHLSEWTASVATIPKEGLMRSGAVVLSGVIHLLDGSTGVYPHRASELKVR